VEVDISLSTRQAALVDDLWDETDANRISATVRADFGGTWYDWDGFVEHASGALDETTRTVEIVIRVPSPFNAVDERPPLLIGSYVRADIVGRAIEAHYAVPRGALRDGPAVWAVTDDHTLVTRPVRVIQEIQDTVFIQADMASATRIVMSPLPVMTEGMKVRFEESDDSSGRTELGEDGEIRPGELTDSDSMAIGGGGQ